MKLIGFLICFSYLSYAADNNCSQAPSLKNDACEMVYATQKCQEYFDENNVPVKKRRSCSSENTPLDEVGLVVGGCALALKDLVRDEIILTIESIDSIWKLAVQNSRVRSEFISRCDQDLECKMNIASGSESLRRLSTEKISKMSTDDLLRREQSENESNDRIRMFQSALQSHRSVETFRDVQQVAHAKALLSATHSWLKDLKIKYECYNTEYAVHLVCYGLFAVGQIAAGPKMVRSALRLAGLATKASNVAQEFFATVNIGSKLNPTKIVGKVKELKLGSDYKLYTITDSSGKTHFFDSTTLHKVERMSNDDVSALESAGKQWKTKRGEIHLNEARLKQEVCTNMKSIQNSPQFAEVRKALKSTESGKFKSEIMTRMYKCSRWGSGAALLSTASNINMDYRDMTGSRNEWNDHQSNLLLGLAAMTAVHTCTGMAPIAVGGNIAGNIYYEEDLGLDIQFDRGKKVQTDHDDFAVGMIGTAAYLALSESIEKKLNIKFSTYCK